jgi:hypothetical protein
LSSGVDAPRIQCGRTGPRASAGTADFYPPPTGLLDLRTPGAASARAQPAAAAHPLASRATPQHRATQRAAPVTLAALPSGVARRRERTAAAEAHRPVPIDGDHLRRADHYAVRAVVAQQWIDPVHDSEGLGLTDRAGPTHCLAHAATDAAGQHLERHRRSLRVRRRPAATWRASRTASAGFPSSGRTCRDRADRRTGRAAGPRRSTAR